MHITEVMLDKNSSCTLNLLMLADDTEETVYNCRAVHLQIFYHRLIDHK